MENVDVEQLIYLVLLGTILMGWFVAENLKRVGTMVKQALAWVFIFLGAIVAVGLWDDIRSSVAPQQAVAEDGSRIEVPRGPDGHFRLTLELNGVPVPFLVDTGATDIVLSREDAERVGLDPDNLRFLGRAQTANGEVRTAFARVQDVRLGPVTFENVRVSVNAGDMRGSLLGMAYLSRFERLEIAGDRLVLEP